MDEFVNEGCEISLAAGHGLGAGEEPLVRHLDVVGRGLVIGPVAAMLDARRRGLHEAVGAFDALDGSEKFGRGRGNEPLDLIGIEHV